jgi:alanine racemase
MDLLTVDVTDLPVSAAQRNQMVSLIGDGLTIDEAAEEADTISYELLTSLGPRYHRVWKS